MDNNQFKPNNRKPNSNSKYMSNCGNCGTSHEPRKCPAYGKQCSKCKKFNHFQELCRSKKGCKLHQVSEGTTAEDEDNESSDSLRCIRVVKKGKQLTSTIETDTSTGRTRIEYQLDTGASCNVFNQKDYNSLGQLLLSNNRLPTLQLYDGTETKH